MKIARSKRIQFILCYGRSFKSFKKELVISDGPQNACEWTNWNKLKEHKQIFQNFVSYVESYQNL